MALRLAMLQLSGPTALNRGRPGSWRERRMPGTGAADTRPILSCYSPPTWADTLLLPICYSSDTLWCSRQCPFQARENSTFPSNGAESSGSASPAITDVNGDSPAEAPETCYLAYTHPILLNLQLGL